MYSRDSRTLEGDALMFGVPEVAENYPACTGPRSGGEGPDGALPFHSPGGVPPGRELLPIGLKLPGSVSRL